MITIFQYNFYLKQRLLQQHHEKKRKTSEKFALGIIPSDNRCVLVEIFILPIIRTKFYCKIHILFNTI